MDSPGNAAYQFVSPETTRIAVCAPTPTVFDVAFSENLIPCTPKPLEPEVAKPPNPFLKR